MTNTPSIPEQFAEPDWLGRPPLDRVVRYEDGTVLLPLGLRLAPSLNLVVFSERRISEAGGWNGPLRMRSLWETLLLELTVRGRHHLEATVRLLSAGFGIDALATSRALFELMMNTYWVYENRHEPELISNNLALHERYHRRARRHELSKVPGYDDHLPDAEPFADDKEAREERKRWGSGFTGSDSIFARIKRWTGHEERSVAAGASPDDQPFFPEDQPGELAAMYALVVSQVNLGMHGALNSYMNRAKLRAAAIDPSGRLHTFSDSDPYPSLHHMLPAIRLAHWSYDRIVRLNLRHYGEGLGVVDGIYDQHLNVLRPTTVARIKGASRNAPCPCGAMEPDGRRRKLKNCHGGQQMSTSDLEKELSHAQWRRYPVWWPDGRPT